MPSISHRIFYCFAVAALLSITAGCNRSARPSGIEKKDSSAIALPNPAPISTEERERIRAACQAWYDSALGPRGFNGGILVAKGGNIVFEQYAGTGHLPGQDSINPHTSLHIASVSKTFTAMAILKLWQDKKLNLDEEYSHYFPSFNYPGVTIRNLLNHRSGLPNYTHFLDNMGWDKKVFVTNQGILDFLIARKTEMVDVAPPDTRFSYSNTNYALLALLIEKITGETYAAYLQQTFFRVLQMKDTYVYSLSDSLKAVPSYDWKGRLLPLDFMDGVYGDKNIYTTVRDLLTWDRALSSHVLLSKETLEQAYAPYSNEKPGIRNYGLGWRMYVYPTGKKIIYHNGRWHGTNAAFIRLINDDATIIAIGNRFTRNIYHSRILASVFGDYFGTTEEEETDSLIGKHSADSLLKLPAPEMTAGSKKTRPQK
ncbi:MAG TPA: serine hydrolase domain-containing protein [Ferruginibacter sp.]|nr:serine hydrolase [Chitinophagaceae bacterium]HRI24455.1 serine hydrolase domain-containing protein [Ferruginibacter sp.]